MKNIKTILLFASLLYLTAALTAEISLNEYGHINRSSISNDNVEYLLENTEYCLKIDGKILKGNSIYRIGEGYLTLTTLEENVPTWIRIYDGSGNLRFDEGFRRVVNFTISSTSDYSAFYNENGVVRLDHRYLSVTEYAGMNIFTLDESGNVISYNIDNRELLYQDLRIDLQQIPRELICIQDKIYVFTSEKLFYLQNGDLNEIRDLKGDFFEAGFYENELWYVLKSDEYNQLNYILYKLTELSEDEEIDRVEITRDLTREHDPIPSPLNYGEEDYPFMIGNSYAALQEYGQAIYMHPGVDFNGEDYQEVYAVKDGFVKAVITTGGEAYWRVAIANEDTAEEVDGYLYAHLNEESITVAVGDTVYAGDLLGTLYDWQVQEFTHIHFARLRHAGETWDGAWWTIDSPQIDFTNIRDSIPPDFEFTIDNDFFAFRDDQGVYLDPDDLSGEFDIISKCHDYCNSPWAQGPYDMWYSIASAFTPDVILYESPHLVWDMPLDVYNFGQYSFLCVNTFYSRDDVLYSIVGYDYIEAYHIVTNADEDPEINELDADETFDSAQFADGLYMIYVHARDQSLNESIAEMLVTFNNGVDAEEEDIPEPVGVTLSNYPNPFNPETVIYFNLPEDGPVKLDIYNTRGQLVVNLINGYMDAGDHGYGWDGTSSDDIAQPSGLYFYKLHYKKKDYARKMLIMK